VANTLAYYITAKLTAVKIFIVQAPERRNSAHCGEYIDAECRYTECHNAESRGVICLHSSFLANDKHLQTLLTGISVAMFISVYD
jgi:hypothetical protein